MAFPKYPETILGWKREPMKIKMSVPAVTHGWGAWIIASSKIKSAQVELPRFGKGCTRRDRFGNERIPNAFNMKPLLCKIREHLTKVLGPCRAIGRL